jgi:hypothetical protein
MPEEYRKLRDKLREQGMSLHDAQREAARVYNQNKKVVRKHPKPTSDKEPPPATTI